jgi:hypothetical protein
LIGGNRIGDRLAAFIILRLETFSSVNLLDVVVPPISMWKHSISGKMLPGKHQMSQR